MHAFLKNLIARITQFGKSRSPAQRPRFVRPTVETMEDRLVLSTSPVAAGLASPVARPPVGLVHAAAVTIPVEQRGLVGPNETPVAKRGIIVDAIPVEQRGAWIQSHKALGARPHRAKGAGHRRHPGQVRGSYSPDGDRLHPGQVRGGWSPDGDRPGFLTLAGAPGLNLTRGW